jgi:RHS repeat-associated protein
MLLQAGEESYLYDQNGNMVEKTSEKGTVKYEYTTDNRLKGVYYADGSDVEFSYDALRRKVMRTQSYFDRELLGKGNEHALENGKGNKNGLKKKLGEATYTEHTNYLYDGMSVFKEYGENGQPLAQFYMGPDQVIAKKMFGYHGRKQEGYEGNVRTRGGLMYYQTDALGNVIDITDRIGERVMSYRYDAFGNLFTQMAAPYNSNGFTGKTYDAKAGLMDFGARWYSPNTGRFTSADTFSGWSNQPLSLNRYSYAYNNPVNFIDPTGRVAVQLEGGGGGSSWSGQTLRRGDEGAYVQDLQSMLNDTGHFSLVEDGIFGPKTEGAVISFQKLAGIAVDGVAGKQTYSSLLTYGKSSGGSGSSSGNEKIENWMGQLLRRGDSGPMVRDLQEMLTKAGYSPGTIDGVFGDNTYNAVRRFQEAKNLKVDGLAGRQTYSSLKQYHSGAKINPWKEEFNKATRTIPYVGQMPYDPSKSQESNFIEAIHYVLDVAGFTPVGPVADIINAGLYTIEGDYGNAGFSLFAAIPIIGDGAKGGKLLLKLDLQFFAKGKVNLSNANPYDLVGRQTRNEMSKKQIQKLAKDMKVNGYSGEPIKVYEVNGKSVIIDGHHRATAAKHAGITNVPIEKITQKELTDVWKVTPEQLIKQVYDAGGF